MVTTIPRQIEASSGFVRQLALYDGALTAGEVAALGSYGSPIGGSATAIPEPFTIIGTLVGGTAAVRMRKKLKTAGN